MALVADGDDADRRDSTRADVATSPEPCDGPRLLCGAVRSVGYAAARSMGIERGTGSLLTAHVDALVNAVNTVGVMGKGLALQFKEAFPDAFASYARACKAGEVRIGTMHVVTRPTSPRFIINFPTKEHWRNPSKLEFIRDGLAGLIDTVRQRAIGSIAVPALGCGNGGLAWSSVRPLIVEAFAQVPDVRVLLFEPVS